MSTVTRRATARSHRPVLATSTLAEAIGLALRSQRGRPAARRRAPAALMLAALAFAGGAQAQSAWINPGMADWFNAGNWSAGVPNNTTIATIDNAGIAEVAPSASGAVTDELHVGVNASGGMLIHAGGTLTSALGILGYNAGSSGIVQVDGAGSNWTSNEIFIGYSGAAELMISDGGSIANALAVIGFNAGSEGVVTVDGAGSTWSSDVLGIGVEGTGRLTISNGGLVSSNQAFIGNLPGSHGTALVDGAGSRWSNALDLFLIGDGSRLAVQNGGTVVSGFNSYMSFGASALVEGAGSTWSNSELIVGAQGAGTLAIRNGGNVFGTVGSVGSGVTGNGVALVDGAGSHWTNSGSFLVGDNGIGELTISNGGRLSNFNATLGFNELSEGTVRVDGSGSVWSNDGALTIGFRGTGALTIGNGGVVSSNGAVVGGTTNGRGTVLVDGAGSRWTSSSDLTVGHDSQLTIRNGGTVSSDINSYIGGNGVALVDGTGSSWSSNDFVVGLEGTGTLAIRNGGSVISASGFIGARDGSNGVASVDGTGSSWASSGVLIVGDSGTGQLTIGNGGSVSNLDAYIGMNGPSAGTVAVEDATSSWRNDGDLFIGMSGTGTLTIANGGTVGATGTVSLAASAGSTGRLNIGAAANDMATAAGMLDAATLAFGDGAGTLVFNHTQNDYAFASAISGNGTIDVFAGTTALTGASSNTGTTNVNGGTLLVEGTLGDTAITVFDGATLGGSGSIAGDVTVQDGGILAAGSSAGTLTVGMLTLNDGAILDYELGQAGVVGGGVNDLIQVNGDLTLDGRLDITDIGGFGAGVYRLIDYSGVLTDNTLDIGTLPTGFGSADLFVQTAIGGQVNLISSAGLTLSFWDGAVLAEHDNAAVDGGDGVWDGTNRNWTQPDGALNGDWNDGQFAVFGGTGGNVEVVGEQAIAGMQFMSAYTLSAGVDAALRIDGAETIIRVDPGVRAEIGVDITGSGGLVKTDTGTLVLSGDNRYAGGTTIRTGTVSISADGNLGAASGGIVFDGGTLQTTADMSSSRDVTITGNGGTLQTDADLTLDGLVSGAGALTKDGDGTLTLSGDNNYTGGTRVLAGTLVGDADSIRGNLANDGSVIFDQVEDDSFTGTIGGTGTMAKRGAGALTLTNFSALDWTIDAGALIARGDLFSGDAAIAAAARLRFQQDAGGTYAGTISGDGRFELASGSLFALTGDSAAFAGTTVVEAGTLHMEGALGGSTLIASGATLSGTGTLGNVDNAGTVAAGNSIGTLTFTGDYVHRDGATLLAEIEPGGNSDLLDIAGTATIEGGQVQVVNLPGQYAGGTRYTLIDAARGVSGSFSVLKQDMPFLDLLLAYDASHVFLDVLRSDTSFASVCGTFNQCQVAATIDTLSTGAAPPSADLITVIDELTTLDIDGALNSFDRLSGEAHGSLAGLLLEGHALYGQSVTQRIAARREAAGADRLHGGAWVRGYGATSELDGDGNAHGADFEQRGVALGVDAWGGERWLIGASANAMRLEADFQPGDHGEADASNVALYASFHGERAYLDAVTSYAWWDNDLARRIEVGTIERETRSEYGGHRFATYLETGLTFALGNRQRLQPLLSVEYARLGQADFREDGAQDLNLIGRSQNVERTTAAAGLHWSSTFVRGDWTLEPTAQARWLRSFGDEYAEQEVALTGAPEVGYRVRGVTWTQDRGLLGIGLHVRRGKRVDLFVDVDYQQGDGFKAHNFGAGLRYRW